MTRVNDSNKLWQIASKFFLATYPFAITWSVWVSKEIVKLPGDYVSKADFSGKLEMIDHRFLALPPQPWQDRMIKVESKIDKMYDELVALKIMLAKKDIAKN